MLRHEPVHLPDAGRCDVSLLTMSDPALVKPRVICPHPEKIAFPTLRGARSYLRKHGLIDEREPYRCGCGKWHTTTKKADDDRQG